MSLVLLSGGLDSTVLATQLTQTHGPNHIEALSVHYGQRHTRELQAAANVAHHLGINHTTLDLSGLGTHLASALTPTSGAGPIPDGHYNPANMHHTVVPNRNAILLMAAAGIAQARAHTTVATAVHGGDHHIYPDCRPDFIATADHTARAGTGGAVSIHAPYTLRTKTDIVRLGAHLGAPLHLTWSCYKGADHHCGTCGTCIERAEAFHAAGIPDPTTYTTPHKGQGAA